jgi:hypothetical protein
MKIIAGITILAVLPCAAWASPQQDADGIVTIKRKGATWSFKVLPEGRKKAVVEENVVEFDVPQRLFAAWAVEEPIPGPGSNPFQNPFESSGTTVLFFREGKRYPDYQGEPADLKAQTAQHLADLQRSMIEGFYQFDFDFPGGTWEELARLLRDRLAAAYEQQFPEILKPFLPAKVDIDLSSPCSVSSVPGRSSRPRSTRCPAWSGRRTRASLSSWTPLRPPDSSCSRTATRWTPWM